jgi:RNA polymerase sigma-70 factor (ECF subfamily)
MTEYSGFAKQLPNAIIEDAQTGGRVAMEAIYRQYANPCFSLANRITGNKEAAQDIVHIVFVKVMKNIGKFDHCGSFAGWFRQIAVNESIAYLKSHHKYIDDTEFEEDLVMYEQHLNANSQFETRWWEACKDLSTLTQKLSEQARAVLILHEIEGYSHQEIAALFGKSESFSKQSLARTLQRLKRLSSIKEL